MAMPLGPTPASSVAITAGGFALRSMTESRLSGTSFFGSAGSSFMVAATSAKDSSGATATFCGGPVTLDGALNSATIFGGETPRSMTVTVSSTGLPGTETVPLLRTTLPSFEDTAICAAAFIEDNGKAAAAIAMAIACVSEMRSVMIIPPGSVWRISLFVELAVEQMENRPRAGDRGPKNQPCQLSAAVNAPS